MEAVKEKLKRRNWPQSAAEAELSRLGNAGQRPGRQPRIKNK